MSLSDEILEFLGGKTVLVIEPTPNYRNSMKNFFNNLKIKNVRLVGSVAEARREMLALKIGFFVCEWQLPEKNGLAFCRELRKEKAFRITPFLLLSTENFRKDVILASEGGVNGYLLKPFSFEDFCTQFHTLISATKNPSPLSSIIERAEAHIDAGEAWIAESLLKEALEIKSTSARAMAGLGRVYLINGDRFQALSAFKQAVELNPEYIDGHRFLLQIAEDQSDIPGILKSASALHGLSPENPKYPLAMARAHIEMGNLDASEQMFKTCVKLSPTLADAYRGLGNVYLQKKEYDNAMKNFEKSLDLEKGDIPTLNSLGLSYIKAGQIEEGIRRYKLALAIDPFDARVLFNQGLAQIELNQLPQAKESFQRAIAADPNMEKAKRQLLKIAKNLPLNTPSDNEILEPEEKTKKGA